MLYGAKYGLFDVSDTCCSFHNHSQLKLGQPFAGLTPIVGIHFSIFCADYYGNLHKP